MQHTKEGILRNSGKRWSNAVSITQDNRNKSERYRFSLLSTWMQELQRRMDLLIEERSTKQPLKWQPKMVYGVKCKQEFLFKGLTGKRNLSLTARGKLSGDAISNARQRTMTGAGIPEEYSPRHLRPACVNMFHFLAVRENDWMTSHELQEYFRHQEDSKVTNDNYIAVTLHDNVWKRWTAMSPKERQAVKTSACFTRV